MGDELSEGGGGILDHPAMTGRKRARCWVERRKSLQAGEIRPHVSVRRTDHDGRALHHMVTGEDHSLAFEQEAAMVRGVTWRVEHPDGQIPRGEDLTIDEKTIGPE